MNMQEQLRAALLAAEKVADDSSAAVAATPDPAAARAEEAIERLGVVDEAQKEFIHEHEQMHERIASQSVNEQTPSPFVSVAEAAAPVVAQAKKAFIKVKGLDEKAVLVQVKRRMYSPYKRDDAESAAYGAGNVNKHLFQGRTNRVKVAIQAYSAVYSFVKDNTVPWSTGIDLLNIDNYVDFTSGLRKLIADADAAVNDLVANWASEVKADVDRLTPTGHANLGDYPSASEVRDRFSIEVRYMPVPTAGDFRVGISDEDKASLQRQLDDAEQNAARHVLTQMIEPMTAAVKKLTVKIGDDGAVFRDSLIDNMVDVANRMARVNISDDPIVSERILDLQSLVSTYANNKDVLRNNQSVREKAATQIDDLMSQMAGLV